MSTSPAVTAPRDVAALSPWIDAAIFSAADVHAAEVLTRLDRRVEVVLGAALAVWAPTHGHTCIDIADMPGLEQLISAETAAASDRADIGSAGAGVAPIDPAALPWPSAEQWLDALASSPVCRIAAAPDEVSVLDARPLVLHGTQLYTQRQWIDECSVAAGLRHRAAAPAIAPLGAAARALLEDALPATDDSGVNLQHAAALMAATSPLAVIVGGPGTGKTHTVARLLAALMTDAADNGRPLHVALAAPTGKAAARMREAIVAAAASIPIPSADGTSTDSADPVDVAAAMSAVDTTTIHRLLGYRPGSRSRFAHDVQHPLRHDVIIIDEASMVALPLMARLLDAVSPTTRLVLVGDPDQLASIAVGSVLADVVRAALDEASPLHGHVVRLGRSRRHEHDSPIGPLADAIRDGNDAQTVALLRASTHSGISGRPDPTIASTVTFIEHADPLGSTGNDGAGVREIVMPAFDAAADAARNGDAAMALQLFTSTRVLCAHRRGPFGAEGWNRAIEGWLGDDGPSAGQSGAGTRRFTPGRALLATRNDPRLSIANGDTGIVVDDPQLGRRAAFVTAAGMRLLAPAQLEAVEPAFAMTIHKSQGSEYRTVVVVLPPASSPLIGRELLYTAVTRTTHHLVVIGTADAVSAAVRTPNRRSSGLATMLAAP